MMNNMKKIVFFIFLIGLFFIADFSSVKAQNKNIENLKGKFLIDSKLDYRVFYISPVDNKLYLSSITDHPSNFYDSFIFSGEEVSNEVIKALPKEAASLRGRRFDFNIDSSVRVGDFDRDEDGLADQIEDIYGTDKENFDTDYDGFSDAQEIANGYNPLKKNEKMPGLTKNIESYKGKMLIQTEGSLKQIWYFNPIDNSLYKVQNNDKKNSEGYFGEHPFATLMKKFGIKTDPEVLKGIPYGDFLFMDKRTKRQ